MSSDSLQSLADDLVRFARARDWLQFHSPKNLACSVMIEAGELLEHFQWATDEQSRVLDDARREAVAAEMADVLIYLVQMSTAMDIDLLAAARRKMAVNEARYPVEKSRGHNRRHDQLD